MSVSLIYPIIVVLLCFDRNTARMAILAILTTLLFPG
jgi:hypothetical protein